MEKVNDCMTLKEFQKEKAFLVCVDSDGCAMDTMDINGRFKSKSVLPVRGGLQMGGRDHCRNECSFCGLFDARL